MLIGGADLREVILAVKSSRRAEPEPDALGSSRLSRRTQVCLRGWSKSRCSTGPATHEIDAWIADADALEAEAVASWELHQHLLSR